MSASDGRPPPMRFTLPPTRSWDLSGLLMTAGAALGFGLSKLLSGPAAGVDGPLPSLSFEIRGYHVHVHHWLWGAVLLLAVAYLTDIARVVSIPPRLKFLAYGLLTGVILQGLFSYSDWWVFVRRA